MSVDDEKNLKKRLFLRQKVNEVFKIDIPVFDDKPIEMAGGRYIRVDAYGTGLECM